MCDPGERGWWFKPGSSSGEGEKGQVWGFWRESPRVMDGTFGVRKGEEPGAAWMVNRGAFQRWERL